MNSCLATQQTIVAEIEAEPALVAANRELIARFEQKIQATLARVWGDAALAAVQNIALPCAVPASTIWLTSLTGHSPCIP
ncbi:hypothetical protein [Thiobacillus denitrificans]|uniref:Uncharacterized protein n=1 Tax=Thiobacillus denitrificans TaxID=36861 RepID=A0A119CV60_THIDE|nr:hypothetical protein [Thiobacillus denitrificans]KVW94293.1 hypothetical protein ABW22_12965 [Thiobacillus denitrificans]